MRHDVLPAVSRSNDDFAAHLGQPEFPPTILVRSSSIVPPAYQFVRLTSRLPLVPNTTRISGFLRVASRTPQRRHGTSCSGATGEKVDAWCWCDADWGRGNTTHRLQTPIDCRQGSHHLVDDPPLARPLSISFLYNTPSFVRDQAASTRHCPSHRICSGTPYWSRGGYLEGWTRAGAVVGEGEMMERNGCPSRGDMAVSVTYLILSTPRPVRSANTTL